MVDYLDRAEFAASLPPDHMLLARGHARTLAVDQDDLRAAIPDPRPAEFVARYARWQQKFTALDDGHAAERVVARLYAEGWLG